MFSERGSPLVAALILCVIAGCQGEGAPEYRPPQVTASGGTRTTTVFGPEHGRTTILPSEVRSLAELDGHPLHRVLDVLALEGSGIVVVTSQEVFFLSGDLTPSARISARGEGPREFGRVAAAAADGTGVWVLDAHNHRLARVSEEGVDSTRDLPPLRVLPRLSLRSSGFMIEAIPPGQLSSAPAGELWRPRTQLLEVREDAEPTVVTELRGEEVASLEREGQVIAAIPLLPHTSDWSTLADGSLIILESSAPGFTVYPVDGADVQRVVVQGDWRDEARLLEEREARLSVARTPSARRMIEELPEQLNLPVYDRLEVGTDTSVWLRRARGRISSLVVAARGDEWHVFSPDGVFLSEIRLPPRFQLLLVARDRLIGVWRNERDVEHLSLIARRLDWR